MVCFSDLVTHGEGCCSIAKRGRLSYSGLTKYSAWVWGEAFLSLSIASVFLSTYIGSRERIRMG